MRNATVGAMLVVAVLFVLPVRQANAESLKEYARVCDQEIGVTVNAFNCLHGYEIAMDGTPGGDCSAPPNLPSAGCRKGSRLGVQTATKEIAVVWLCRKKGNLPANDAKFDDIAVIQTNFRNGATCFYQKLDEKGVDGSAVPAPSDETRKFWLELDGVKRQECASCHDTGLLRTPYLTQVVDKNGKRVLPATRHTENYWFPGLTLNEWNGKVFRILDSASHKNCSTCHKMGANTIDPSFGTSTWLGLLATGDVKTPHFKHGAAYWMRPGNKQPNAEDIADAKRMAGCASGVYADCSLELWGGQIKALTDVLRMRGLPELMLPIQK